jgi:hypothetical protein
MTVIDPVRKSFMRARGFEVAMLTFSRDEPRKLLRVGYRYVGAADDEGSLCEGRETATDRGGARAIAQAS